MKQAIELAIRTWYPKDHELHMNPHHPLGKLLGEWGELLDDYMKSLYKPGYEFNPIDELGDIWYYIRILCYQESCEPRLLESLGISELDIKINFLDDDTDILIKAALYKLNQYALIKELVSGLAISTEFVLTVQYSILVEIGKRYNLGLSDLTRSNWEKLKPGSERGEEWMKARVSTDYTGGKIGLK